MNPASRSANPKRSSQTIVDSSVVRACCLESDRESRETITILEVGRRQEHKRGMERFGVGRTICIKAPGRTRRGFLVQEGVEELHITARPV